MIPEAAIAMLACARIGAIHSVVFGGFAATELATRIEDAAPSTAVGITSTLAVILVLNIIILCCRFTIRRMGRRRAWHKQRQFEILGAEAEPLLRDNERLVITRQMNPET